MALHHLPYFIRTCLVIQTPRPDQGAVKFFARCQLGELQSQDCERFGLLPGRLPQLVLAVILLARDIFDFLRQRPETPPDQDHPAGHDSDSDDNQKSHRIRFPMP